MTLRNLETRIVKLEAIRRHEDQILVIWRKPDGDLREAVAGATFAPGDKAICVEWFGHDPMPGPKWHSDLRPTFDKVEQDYVDRSINRIVEAQSRPIAAITRARKSSEYGFGIPCWPPPSTKLESYSRLHENTPPIQSSRETL
jgi:hypothetical protein